MNGTPAGKALTDQEKDQLFEANVKQVDKMQVGAGSLVQGLLDESEKPERHTYIRLRDAVPGGFVIMYDFVQGELTWVHGLDSASIFETPRSRRSRSRRHFTFYQYDRTR